MRNKSGFAKRLIVALGLSLVLVGGGTMAAPVDSTTDAFVSISEPNDEPIDISDALRKAKASTLSLAQIDKQLDAVVLYEEDGERYAVVRADLVGSANIGIDPVLLKELGIDVVRIIIQPNHEDLEHLLMPDDDESHEMIIREVNEGQGFAPHGDITPNARYTITETQFSRWAYVPTFGVSNGTDTSTAGVRGLGCRNDGPTVIEGECKLSVQATATATASSNLGKSDILFNFGISVGLKLSETLSFTFYRLNPYTYQEIHPMVRWNTKSWTESRDVEQRQCEIDDTDPYWHVCGPWRHVRTEYTTGSGRSVDIFFIDVKEKPI